MKCPFKKETYTRSSDPMYHGYPANKETFEIFTECIKYECAIYNKSSGCCGFLKAITIPIQPTGS